MLYRIFENETGDYVTADGTRCLLAKANSMTADQRPLWTYFDTLDEALGAWGLTYAPLPEPQTEEN